MMTSEQAVDWIRARSKVVTWQKIADEIGEELGTVFAWHSRKKVPKWRLPAVTMAAKRLAKRRKTAA